MVMLEEQTLIGKFESHETEHQRAVVHLSSRVVPVVTFKFMSVKDWVVSADATLGYEIATIDNIRKPDPNAFAKWIQFLADRGIDVKTQNIVSLHNYDRKLKFSIWSDVVDEDTTAFNSILGENWPKE